MGWEEEVGVLKGRMKVINGLRGTKHKLGFKVHWML